jgi:hypothetical protein
MKARIKVKFLKMLRSGLYTQTTGQLKTVSAEGEEAYCASGLLCELHRLANLEVAKWKKQLPSTSDRAYVYRIKGKTSPAKFLYMCPTFVAEWAGIDPEMYLVYKKKTQNLWELNDDGLSFKQLARLIEKQW